jgi:hypothetical protein
VLPPVNGKNNRLFSVKPKVHRVWKAAQNSPPDLTTNTTELLWPFTDTSDDGGNIGCEGIAETSLPLLIPGTRLEHFGLRLWSEADRRHNSTPQLPENLVPWYRRAWIVQMFSPAAIEFCLFPGR